MDNLNVKLVVTSFLQHVNFLKYITSVTFVILPDHLPACNRRLYTLKR